MNKNRTHRNRTTKRPENSASLGTKTVTIPLDEYAKFVFCEKYVKSIIKTINDDGYYSLRDNGLLIDMMGGQY